MIRQRLLVFALVIAALQVSGCVSVQTVSGGRSVMLVVPGFDTGVRSNRAGTTYYNERWGSDPSSHPAVNGVPRASAVLRVAPEGEKAETGSGSASSDDVQTLPTVSAPAIYPPYAARTSREAAADGQTSGAIIGALIGAQAGNRLAGVAVGAAGGALIGGKMNDPCQPDVNYGSFWGGVAGAWLGSLFGGGRGRDFFIALGAAGGAVRGTERVGDGRRCR